MDKKTQELENREWFDIFVVERWIIIGSSVEDGAWSKYRGLVTTEFLSETSNRAPIFPAYELIIIRPVLNVSFLEENGAERKSV